jgi:hypothetical protein
MFAQGILARSWLGMGYIFVLVCMASLNVTTSEVAAVSQLLHLLSASSALTKRTEFRVVNGSRVTLFMSTRTFLLNMYTNVDDSFFSDVWSRDAIHTFGVF